MIVTPEWPTMDVVELWHEVRAGTPGAREEMERRKAAGELPTADTVPEAT